LPRMQRKPHDVIQITSSTAFIAGNA